MATNKSNVKKNNDEKTQPQELNLAGEIEKIEKEIIDESIKITKNEVSSCYTLVVKTKRLLELRLMK